MEYRIIQSKSSYFTVIKPYLQNDSLVPVQYESPVKENNTWINSKLFHQSLVEVDSGDFYLFLDPAFDFSLGQDNSGRRTFTNTRGFNAGGRIGSKFAFGTNFYENQAIFPDWVHNGIRNKVIPGQGMGRLKQQTWDYAHSSGYVSFSPVTKLNIQLGQGKNFIGDGYRSLLLSDAAYNYPYSRFSFISNRFMYSWMLGIVQDLSISKGVDQYTYGKRMISSHVFSTNIGSALQVSIIKNTVYDNPDTTGKFSPRFEEFNPVMLPVSSGRSHSVWGMNVKMMVSKHWWLYGQAAFDNLTGKDNMHTGFQLGSKYYDAFGLKGLYLQAEYNGIETETYTSGNKSLQWMHFGEPLAHPSGNNFSEGIFYAVYTWKRWQFSSFTRLSQVYKKNVISPGNKFAFPTMSNGRTIHNNTQLNWFLNPKTTAHFSLGYIIHQDEVAGIKSTQNMIYFSFRTALFNNYLSY